MSEIWAQTNQKYLAACIEEVKTLLKNHISRTPWKKPEASEPPLTREGPANPPAIEALSSLFGLTKFEKLVLLLCAASELDAEVKDLCSKAHENPNMPYPTFGLALAAFPRRPLERIITFSSTKKIQASSNRPKQPLGLNRRLPANHLRARSAFLNRRFLP